MMKTIIYRLNSAYLGVISVFGFTIKGVFMLDLSALRQEYTSAELSEHEVHADPFLQFEDWFLQAQKAEVPEPNAMVLATTDAHAQPHTRIMLIKEVRTDGFVWFTNYNSAKGQDLANNPQASLLFFWQPLQRQVRIEGTVKKLDPLESDEYFYSRPLSSQIGAWSSPQSQVIENRDVLERNAAEVTQRYGQTPPRPEHWGGFILEPHYLEFWQGRASRLHDRVAYQKLDDGSWRTVRLAP